MEVRAIREDRAIKEVKAIKETVRGMAVSF
jgi:hypothetical protein